MRWEYKVERVEWHPNATLQQLNDLFNDRGLSGWELVTEQISGGTTRYIWKRPCDPQ
jgi:hypothetical protein